MLASADRRRIVLVILAAVCAACADVEDEAVEVPTGEAGPAPVVPDTAVAPADIEVIPGEQVRPL